MQYVVTMKFETDPDGDCYFYGPPRWMRRGDVMYRGFNITGFYVDPMSLIDAFDWQAAFCLPRQAVSAARAERDSFIRASRFALSMLVAFLRSLILRPAKPMPPEWEVEAGADSIPTRAAPGGWMGLYIPLC